MRVNNTEQFRQIYKGKAHKCIITDLMPRTTYRFRVAAGKEEGETLGDWSDVTSIATKDNQDFDPSVVVTQPPVAGKKRGSPKNCLIFEKAGT